MQSCYSAKYWLQGVNLNINTFVNNHREQSVTLTFKVTCSEMSLDQYILQILVLQRVDFDIHVQNAQNQPKETK